MRIEIPDEELERAFARALDTCIERFVLRLQSISLERAAELLDMAPATFRALLRRKGISVERYSSKLIRIPLADVMKLKETNRTGASRVAGLKWPT